MALYRSRRKPPSEDQPPLAAVERELETEDRNNLKILAVIALFIVAGLWIYAQTNDDAAVTDVQPPAAPVEQTTTGAAGSPPPAKPATPVLPDNRTLETPIPPRGPHPTEQ